MFVKETIIHVEGKIHLSVIHFKTLRLPGGLYFMYVLVILLFMK